MGLAAVSVFGIVTVQVNKSVDLQPELSATLKKQTLEEGASQSPAPVAQAEPPAPPPAAASPLAAVTPPPPEPAAKMDMNALEKSKAPSRKKAMKPSVYDADSDWSNAGLGTRDSKNKDYAYDRRDAMTQSGAFSKPKPMLVPSGKGAPSTPPAPTQAAPPPPAEPMAAPADDAMDEEDNMGAVYGSSEAQVQQQAPSRGSLSLREAKRGNTAPAADKEAAPAKVASLDTAMPSQAKQEQRARAPEASSAAGGAASVGRAERQAASPDELSKLASVAMRRGDRVSEAQYLHQALDAGATGKDRLGLLSRLCDAEFAIGRRQAAIEACNMAIEEAPSSSAAQVARRRLSQESVDTQPGTRLSAPKSSAPLKASEMEAPASAPVQAQ
jgi:hypothetical protein